MLCRWLGRKVFAGLVFPVVALILAVAQPAEAQPYTLSFESYPASITAGSTVDFRVRVVDSGGNPAPFVNVLFNLRAKSGTYAPFRFSDSNGIATLNWNFLPLNDYDPTTDVRALVLDGGTLQSNILNGAAINIVSGNTLPSAPTGVTATQSPFFQAADVSFTPPGYAGSPALTSYTVTASPGGASATCLGSPCTVGVLSFGTTYTFTVTANSPAGSSPPSAPSAPLTLLSGNTNLASLSVSSGTLSPAFDPGFSSYSVNVPNAVTNFSFVPTPAESGATILFNGQTLAPGTIILVTTLNVGANSAVFAIQAPNGAVRNYGLTINRAPSSDATLSSLTINTGTLSPAFSPGTTSYAVNLPNTTSSLSLVPVAASSSSTIRVNGNVTASGSSAAVPLAVGANAISVQVTAQDGTTVQTYTVNANRAPSANASLSGLSVSAGTLSPAFSSGVTDYTVSVPFGVTAFSLTPTLADATASLQVNGAAATSGAAAGPFTLSLGSNVFTVQTTAQDGATSSTYRVTVTRGQAIGALALTANPGTVAQGAPVTLEATYTGPTAATGTVTFLNGTTPLATVALAGNRASLTLTTLPVGTQSLTARYNGDASNQAVTSPPVTVVVNGRPSPANDPSVRAQVTAQINSALRFGQTQMEGVTSRLEQLHDQDDTEGTPDAGPGSTGSAGFARSTPGAGPNRTAAASRGEALAEATTRALETGGTLSTLSQGRGLPENPLPQGPATAGLVLPGTPLPPQNDLSRGIQQIATAIPAFAEALNRQGSLPFKVWAGTSFGIGRPRIDGTYNQRFNNAHFVVGLDRRFTPDLTAGLAVSATFDNLELGSDGSRIRGFSPSLALYASWRVLPQTYLDVLGGAGLIRFDTQRFSTAGGVMLDGDRSGRSAFGAVGLTRRFTKDNWNVSLFGRFDIMAAWLDGYAEKGDPIWAVRYGRSSIQSYAAVIGGRFGYDIRQSWGTLTPLLRLEYRHNFQGSFSQAVGYVDGFSPGVITGASRWRGQISGGLGLRARIGDDLALEFGYLASGTAERMEMQRFTGSIRYAF